MKVSLTWLQKYFETPLPAADVVADALTFHAFEIEEVEGDMIDVKVLPDRAAYALSHRGVAKEIAASLPLSLSSDPLSEPLPTHPTTAALKVSIENAEKCDRYMGALVTGVTVTESPAWLQEALAAVGQRSINNVVDATNYVMLNIGQPLHAFDAAKLQKNAEGAYEIKVRGAYEGESITTLTGEEYALPEDTLVITDAVSDAAIGIAGIKGGKRAEIDTTTTDIVIESAHFDGSSVRRAAQALKLWTDASQRFQNKISPELAAYGMRDVLALIQEVAGGTLAGVTEVNTVPHMPAHTVSVSVTEINKLLGSTYAAVEVRDALTRLGLTYEEQNDVFTVTAPFERRDLTIPQDVVEEVGRVLGYEHIASASLEPFPRDIDQEQYAGIERIKDVLIDRGFIEISTQSFATAGEIELANPLDTKKPWLRASLVENMATALTHAKNVAPRVLGPEDAIKLFEIGTVFKKEGEHLSLVLGYAQLKGKQSAAYLPDVVDALRSELGLTVSGTSIDAGLMEIDLRDAAFDSYGKGYVPHRMRLNSYTPYSVYPFALRDVAVWTPEGTEESEVQNAIIEEAGELLARIDLFDQFEKEGRTSYAFRLVFEAPDRTLSDQDLTPTMDRIYARLRANEGWEIR